MENHPVTHFMNFCHIINLEQMDQSLPYQETYFVNFLK